MIIPKGKLIVIGGSVDKGSDPKMAEDQPKQIKFFEKGILKRMSMESAKGNLSRIEIGITINLFNFKIKGVGSTPTP